jgi:hypothetical protein
MIFPMAARILVFSRNRTAAAHEEAFLRRYPEAWFAHRNEAIRCRELGLPVPEIPGLPAGLDDASLDERTPTVGRGRRRRRVPVSR